MYNLINDCGNGLLRWGYYLSILVLFTLTSQGFAAKKQTVLIINSYHQGLSWTDKITNTIQVAFPETEYELFIEYLDSKRRQFSVFENDITKLLVAKFSITQPNIIISVDNVALNFALKLRPKLSELIPIVFCGINNFEDEMISDVKNISGIIEVSSPRQTLQMALSLHPQTKRVFIISDTTETGIAETRHAQIELKNISGVSIHWLLGQKTEELLTNLRRLTENDLVLLILFNRDSENKYYSYEESARMIVGTAPCPVYGLWDFYIQSGVVGGLLVNGRDQGLGAAVIGKKVLDGENVNQIPVIREGSNAWIFDYGTLTKWGIEENQLPEGYRIENKPKSWVKENIRTVIAIFLIMVIEAAVIVLLIIIYLGYRRKSINRLKASEAMYRMIYDFAPIGMFKFDVNGQIELVNENFTSITGVNNGLPTLKDLQLEKIEYLQDIKQNTASEVSFVRPSDGKERILRVVVKSPDPDKNIKGIGLIEDVTLQREQHMSLAESESRYKSIFNNNHAIILLIDPKTLRIVDANTAALNFYGWEYKSMITKRISDINTAPEDDIRKQIGRVLNHQRNHFIFKHIRAQGDVRNVEVYSGPITINNKLLIYSIIHDVTKRVAAETKNIQNANRLKAVEKILKLYDNPGDELWRYALQKAVDLTSSEIGFVFTYDEHEQEFTFKLYNDFAIKTCKSSVSRTKYKLSEVALLGQVIESRDSLIINDYRNTTLEKHKLPPGHMPVDRFLLVPIFSGQEIVAVVAVANKPEEYSNEDVSQLSLLMDAVWNVVQRKEAENKLFLRNQQLSEIIRQKDKLLSIIAHDIRNPFTTLMGLSDLLDRKIETQPMEKNRRMVKILRESILDILNLFENLLEWAQIQTKDAILSIKPISISSILQSAVDTYGKFAGLKGIDVSMNAPENISVMADDRALDMILRNLISNAVKFTHPGGTIVLQAEVYEEKYVRIKVSDSGIGIPEEIQKTLFSFTGDSPRSGTSGERGSGIGLALCYDFISLMKGQISVNSAAGKGTCFEILLPRANEK